MLQAAFAGVGGGTFGVRDPIARAAVIATVSDTAAEIVCAVYLVLIAPAATGAAMFMDNLGNQRSTLSALGEDLRYKRSW